MLLWPLPRPLGASLPLLTFPVPRVTQGRPSPLVIPVPLWQLVGQTWGVSVTCCQSPGELSANTCTWAEARPLGSASPALDLGLGMSLGTVRRSWAILLCQGLGNLLTIFEQGGWG